MLRAERFRTLLVPLSVVIGLCLGGVPGPVAAHDEDAAPPPPAGISLKPRFVAQSSDFELVGVAEGKTLTIYLDRFTDDQPVIGAKLDVEVNGQTTSATAKPGGVYMLTANWVAQPGHHDVIVTIRSDQGSDLLAGTLNIPAAPVAAIVPNKGGLLQSSAPSNIVAFLLGMLATAAWSRSSSLAAIMGGAANRVRRRGARIIGAAGRRLGDVNAGLRQARSGGIDLPAALRALRGRVGGTARAARATVLLRRSAKLGDGEIPAWRRSLAAIEPVLKRSAAERVRASTVAGVFLAAIVAIVLFLYGRGVLAHEADEVASPASSASAAAAAAAGDVDSGPHRLLDGSLFIPKASQRLLDVRTTITRKSEVSRSVRVIGQVIPDPGTSGEVHAMIRGRLEPNDGVWPTIGEKVKAGQVLAWVVPIVNPIDRGIILQQIAQIDDEVALAEKRLKQVGAPNANPAPNEIDKVRDELANLGRRRAAIAAVVRDRDTLRAPLLAPSSGLIAASFAVAGEVVGEQQKLFEVVNLERLWVQASAYDITGMGKVVDANAETAAGGHYHLKFVSRGPQLQRQTIPLFFKIDHPDAALSVGSLLTVMVNTDGERAGVVVPRTAVVRDTSGQDIVWRHAYAETFVPVPVRIEPVDGSNVLVVAGLDTHTRIVVDAAELLNQIR